MAAAMISKAAVFRVPTAGKACPPSRDGRRPSFAIPLFEPALCAFPWHAASPGLVRRFFECACLWLAQGNRQVTKAAVEWYGPDRAGFLGPFTDPPSYLNGEYPGDYGARPAWSPPPVLRTPGARLHTAPPTPRALLREPAATALVTGPASSSRTWRLLAIELAR